jgi:leucyl-tRNA synthetase
MMPVDWKRIEDHWIQEWEKAGVFNSDPTGAKPKFFLTVAYPYPNSPQHIGHGRTYTTTDIHARYKRMRGFNVLFPIAFHYTGTPILAMAKRLADRDPELIRDFTEVYHVPRTKLDDLTDPMKIAQYFHAEIKQGMREIGFSIDWRREFTTIDPTYSRFIEWQFNRLREKNLISRGSHPVGWCPNDGNPVGQHDTQDDVEPEIGEFTLIKFQMDDAALPTATLRPETVFGVTNIWLNPSADYVRVMVDGKERWIVSRECAEKLRLLNHAITVEAEVRPSEIIGKHVVNPVTATKIPIFPATFVDPKNATGVVMSVPAHAPYDYQALRELHGNPSSVMQFGFSEDYVRSIRPIGVITFEGASEIPAEDLVIKAGVRSQDDPKLDDVTNELYSREFHSGRMKANTGVYAGLRVDEGRDRVKNDLISSGNGSSMYEILNFPVICRCGTQCVVKIFENQWFIDYGQETWKEHTREWLRQMTITPPEFRPEFEYTIGWLRVKACARKSGLGTRLPWDPDWVIESLSDSVIYMAYYTLKKTIIEQGLKAENLSDEIFDFVFLGKGDLRQVAGHANMTESVLADLRKQFTYYYPLDTRHSGRDLVPNHLTFFIFNHVALFPPELRPRQIVVNGFVLMEGTKMSKSLANILPLRDAIRKHGADAARITMTSTAELAQDVDFSPQLAESIRERLERLLAFAGQASEGKQTEVSLLALQDRWLRSRINRAVNRVTEALDSLRVREALQEALFNLDNDMQWYLRRCSAKNGENTHGNPDMVRWALRVRAQLLAPFAPFVAEEIWHAIGGEGFVSTSSWPRVDESALDEGLEASEDVLRAVMEDTQEIITVTKTKPSVIHYYSASDWKWDAYLELLNQPGPRSAMGGLIRKYTSAAPAIKPGSVAKTIQAFTEDVAKMNSEMRVTRAKLKRIDEVGILQDARSLLKATFKSEIMIHSEDDETKHDPKGRAAIAKPYRPAIYIE